MVKNIRDLSLFDSTFWRLSESTPIKFPDLFSPWRRTLIVKSGHFDGNIRYLTNKNLASTSDESKNRSISIELIESWDRLQTTWRGRGCLNKPQHLKTALFTVSAIRRTGSKLPQIPYTWFAHDSLKIVGCHRCTHVKVKCI